MLDPYYCNYQSMLLNIAERQWPHLHHSRSLRSLTFGDLSCTIHHHTVHTGSVFPVYHQLLVPNTTIKFTLYSFDIINFSIYIYMGEGRGVHRVLVGKPEGKRRLGRPRRRWEDNTTMVLQEMGGGCGDWMELAQDRDRWRALVSTVRNLRVPKMQGISWLAAEPVSFSRTLLHGLGK